MQYYSLQNWTSLSLPDTSTGGHCFCSGLAFSFFLELFLCSSPVAYWAPTDLGSSSFSVIIFLSFHTVYGVLVAKILGWFAISFFSGPRFVRTLYYDLSVQGGPAQHGPLLRELSKPLRHDKAMIHERIHILILNFFIF